MMHFIWRAEHMPLFLKVYKKHECLWNNKTPSYNNAILRQKAYLSLIKELNIPGLTVAHVKAKIKTIRTRYSTELTKILQSEESGEAEEIYEPRLFWFREADSFLRAVCIPKRSYWSGQSFGISTELNTSIDDTNMDSSIVNGRGHDNNPNIEPKGEMKKRKAEQVEATCYPEKIRKEVYSELDEFDLFCSSLAVQLKKMPLHRAVVCQEKLQSVMTQERLAYIMENERTKAALHHKTIPVECVMEDEHTPSLVLSKSLPYLSQIFDENFSS